MVSITHISELKIGNHCCSPIKSSIFIIPSTYSQSGDSTSKLEGQIIVYMISQKMRRFFIEVKCIIIPIIREKNIILALRLSKVFFLRIYGYYSLIFTNNNHYFTIVEEYSILNSAFVRKKNNCSNIFCVNTTNILRWLLI